VLLASQRLERRVESVIRVATPLVMQASTWDSFFLQSEVVTEDFSLERANQEQQERERF
jgi:virulence-associated protein VagC